MLQPDVERSYYDSEDDEIDNDNGDNKYEEFSSYFQ